eukprot:CAMPEP_0116014202 /NCGR_PEP_ID=MMETSP0321-20121206/6149_1 /TAXON_ID=163516 /ORGANISM="Leptocylindrus danicus var. danicus, Strain B650" /LENGTH=515 /DNA_ID=CAMNT_0003483833 /DNA_START=77 /DNA_END=1624 /DNA_ORIENTATION=+
MSTQKLLDDHSSTKKHAADDDMAYSNTPITVMGTPIGGGQQQPTSSDYTKGEDQGNHFRDVGFGVLYYLNFFAIVAVAALYGPDALSKSDDDGDTDPVDDKSDSVSSYDGYIYVGVVCGVSSLILSGLSFSVMTRIAEFLIKFSLLFSVGLSGLLCIVSFASSNWVGGAVGLIFFALFVCYACSVWSRIPFATANLVTAIAAIRANFGVGLAAYIFVIVGFAWTMLWTIAFVGAASASEVCSPKEDDDGNEIEGEETCSGNAFYFFLLLISFYWVHQVLTNTLIVTVAGTVGTWWFAPEEANSCCSQGVRDSFMRATTYSFGSVCFGSLIVAIIQALKTMVEMARNEEGGDNILLCIADCLLGCIESLVEYFNKWAFIYVGLYGYAYCEAGKNVMNLFKSRGWDAIIVDDLTDMVFGMVSFAIGLITGAIGIVLEQSTDWFDDNDNDDINPTWVTFILGLIIGWIIASILMGTISSAVNTVIVLFAEAPAEFDQNHNELSRKMRAAYLEYHPGSL